MKIVLFIYRNIQYWKILVSGNDYNPYIRVFSFTYYTRELKISLTYRYLIENMLQNSSVAKSRVFLWNYCDIDDIESKNAYIQYVKSYVTNNEWHDSLSSICRRFKVQVIKSNYAIKIIKMFEKKKCYLEVQRSAFLTRKFLVLNNW